MQKTKNIKTKNSKQPTIVTKHNINQKAKKSKKIKCKQIYKTPRKKKKKKNKKK